ncbi:purine and uridine phosphorylase [Aspergillus sclerotiicarbonarius CBS 121057]|uniref:Purine and uridine phosphorylase n=1 Tax=Aspergillus sclerotiicarbonarius (strain CBS 121057 / IBT 28362) TaxID=1448318 RepID=A0A319DZC0_ASPSB|nr:purine and uridine phosphorylase [Aspergillus sclerotiicarbonarius CBS 121057]
MDPERLKRLAPFQSLEDSWRKRQRMLPPADPTLSSRCYNPSQTQPSASSQCPPRNTRKPRCHDDYTIGWICALEVELAAAEAMLDEIHPTLPRVGSDPNAYNLGRIGRHNIVITCLPTGGMGTNSAATAAANLLRSFPKVRFGLMVGIGGGVPGDPSDDPGEDIRLGDIVVSKPTESLGGVIQYDFGKATIEHELQRTGWLNAPPHELRTGVLKLQARHRREGSLTSHFLAEMLGRYPRMAKEFRHQSAEHDRLFHADYCHEENEKECTSCDPTQAVIVVKSGAVREKLRQELGILCVEMEAAGLMNNFPCLVVRGIADYADTHKNKRWQPYAAATAAAYTKELLQMIPAVDVECMTEAAKLPGILREEFDTVNAKLDSLMQVARLSSENTDLVQQFQTESVSQMQRMEDKLKQLVDYMEVNRSMPTPLKILFRKIRGSANGRKESQRGDLGDLVAEIHNWHHVITPGTKIVMDITFKRGTTLRKHSCPRCHSVNSETLSQNTRVTCHNCRLDFDIEETNRVVELPDEDNHTTADRTSHNERAPLSQDSGEETFSGMSYIHHGTPPLAGSSVISMPLNAIVPTTDVESHNGQITWLNHGHPFLLVTQDEHQVQKWHSLCKRHMDMGLTIGGL